jgi:protoporphyrinogen oxidase
MQKFEYVIIGAGPTGLGAAYRLRELGNNDFVVLELSESVGGLAKSFIDENGFTWDIGGHVQFSHYRYFDELMVKALGSEGWLHHQRESWVWMKDRFVPYPFQNNIRYLPQEVMLRCLDGVIKANRTVKQDTPHNFEDWILRTFGQGIAEEFMIPYNFRVWAYQPEQMSYQWVGERVAVADLQRIVRNVVLQKDDVSWGPNNTFQFPRNGGTGAIWKAIAELVGWENIRLKSRVVKVSPKAKTIELDSGVRVGYEYLLSTIPLNIFATQIAELPDALRKRTSELKYSSSNIVGVGLKGQPKNELKHKCWMYFPESNCPFYRVTVFSNYSPNNVPDPETTWSLMTETSESSHKPVDRSKLITETIEGLLNTKLIESAEDVVSTWVHSVEYGYPTPSLERDPILTEVIPTLDSLGVYSRGRFGGWKYEVSNQDHSLMQGVEWVNRMALGVPETTYFYPNVANSNWGK